MSGLAALESYELSAPDTWASIPVTAAEPGWAREVADLLCDGESARAELAARLERSHPLLVDEPHLVLGVWVPDRSEPEVAGLVTMDLILPDGNRPLTRGYYRSLIDPDRRRGHTVYGRGVDELDVPAGPALLVQEVISRPDEGSFPARSTLQENVIYTVFPPGCRDALELAFATPVLHLGDALAADAASVVDTLRITLAEVTG